MLSLLFSPMAFPSFGASPHGAGGMLPGYPVARPSYPVMMPEGFPSGVPYGPGEYPPLDDILGTGEI